MSNAAAVVVNSNSEARTRRDAPPGASAGDSHSSRALDTKLLTPAPDCVSPSNAQVVVSPKLMPDSHCTAPPCAATTSGVTLRTIIGSAPRSVASQETKRVCAGENRATLAAVQLDTPLYKTSTYASSSASSPLNASRSRAKPGAFGGAEHDAKVGVTFACLDSWPSRHTASGLATMVSP